MPTAVELLNVSKSFGAIKALRGVTLGLEEGEAVAFLGPNGAGKSTLLKIVATQSSPTSGTVKVLGRDVSKEPEAVKRSVGMVGHGSFLYDELTVEENLEFYGGFFNATRDDLGRVLEMTDLKRWRRVKAGHLSFGLRKRSDIARALLGNPRVLVLDELFSGLDREASDSLVGYLKSARELTLLVSSHSLERLRELCDRGIYLRGGRIERDVGF
ncbi:MAG: ABC transporter ATP-binding protein [Candidatus Bathyarchaeota archaeon]|nr:MAG: ABC transporter ATP-binding protein [Candidatus Bathyarchaeota archaeon]